MSSFPQEIFQCIVNEVDDVSDLLSLALTCRALCQVIVPWYIEYRWIYCASGRKDIWKILSNKPYLAARLRKLEIVIEKDDIAMPVIPKSLSRFPEYKKHRRKPSTKDDSCEVMNSLVDLMRHTDLTRFLWSYPIDVTNSFAVLLPKLFDYSPRLQELGITTYSGHYPVRPFQPLDHKEISMPFLHTVCLSLGNYCVNSTAIASGIINALIHSCPSIVDLQIRLRGHHLLAQFLQQGTWPKIKRLTLYGFGFYDYTMGIPDRDFMRNFLSRHPSLQCLAVDGDVFANEEYVAEDALPNLHSFDRTRELGHLHEPYIRVLPATIAQNIHHLSIGITRKYLPDIKKMTSLQTCVIEIHDWTPSIIELLDALPVSLERISIQERYRSHQDPESWIEDAHLWIPSLMRLQNLTHIGALFCYAELTKRADRDLMGELCSLPHLSYVQVMRQRQTQWIVLHRGEDGQYIRGSRLPRRTAIDVAHWGGQFKGLTPEKRNKVNLL
ncbi:hypothetical protein M422DRAFT_28106 [Sphaerobolus stellatus SS14]|nr:hypothetical protein M422DRAFT_28106 [Sphaerobolus stellatus SS14]